MQRQFKTHTLRCVLITNESHPEIKFDVFERLNTNTVPLNPQELRNCVYRGPLNQLLQEASLQSDWLGILGKKSPDKRLRDEEIILRFFAFQILGLASYRTPLKHWLNEAAKAGRSFSPQKIRALRDRWNNSVQNSLSWFDKSECFRRKNSRSVNRALFDLVMFSAATKSAAEAAGSRAAFRERYAMLETNSEFQDLIGRSVDHKKRTLRRFEIWREVMGDLA
jgi:hypothetical protein